MTLISIKNASKDFGIKNLFKNLDLHINQRERLGLIGPNGAGKSTILKVLAGIEPLIEGERLCSNSTIIKIVGQENLIVTDESILEAVLKGCGNKKDLLINFQKISKAVAENPKDQNLLKRLGNISSEMDICGAWNLEQKCQEILRRLGIKDLQRPIKELSGGFLKRVNLAAALLENPDVLLLDEPTNHLDASAVEWLQKWLANFKGAIVLVTHDRYVLDRVTTKLIEVREGKVNTYLGNYSYFLEKKTEQQQSEASSHQKIKGILRKELA